MEAEKCCVHGGNKTYQTDSHTYPGVKIDAGNNRVTEINPRIEKHTKSFFMMYPLLKEKKTPQEAKVTVFYTKLRPTLLCGSECWALTHIAT